jgi:hypothetical protein
VSYGTTSFTYNGLSQPLTVTSPGVVNPITSVTHTARATYTYDNAGRRLSQAVSDLTGGDATRTTSWSYDTHGRLAVTTNPDGSHNRPVVERRRRHHAEDRARRARAQLQLRLRPPTDHHHRHRTGVDPETTATTLQLESRSYDPAGYLTAITDAAGRLTRYSYYADNLPKQTKRDYPGQRLPEPRTSSLSRGPHLRRRRSRHDVDHPRTQHAGRHRRHDIHLRPGRNVTTQAFDPTGLNRITTNGSNLDSTVAYTNSTGAASPGRTETIDYTYDTQPSSHHHGRRVLDDGGDDDVRT